VALSFGWSGESWCESSGSGGGEESGSSCSGLALPHRPLTHHPSPTAVRPTPQEVIPKDKRPVTKHWNYVGLAIFLYYFGALIYYIYIRATKTLNMGYLG
jgi:hypothetical protein